MTDFDTSAMGAFNDMKDALKEAAEDSPNGKRERRKLAEAIIGFLLIVIAILSLLYMSTLSDVIQYLWSK